MTLWTKSSVLILVFSTQAYSAANYTVTQEGNLLQISSPYGSKMFFGDAGFEKMKEYQFEIPIRDLIPQTQAAGGGSGGGVGGDKSAVSAGSPESIGQDDDLILEANRLYSTGKFDESLKFVDELLRRSPGSTRGWVMKGSLLHVLGHPDLAKKSWQRALELDPANEQIKNILESKQ